MFILTSKVDFLLDIRRYRNVWKIQKHCHSASNTEIYRFSGSLALSNSGCPQQQTGLNSR